MRGPKLLTALAALVLACTTEAATDAGAPEHPSFRRIRVLITESAGSRAAVYDVADREIVAVLDDAGDVRRTSLDGAIAVGDGPRPSFVTSGVAVVDHEDHVHVYKSPPARVGDSGIAEATSATASRAGYFGLSGRTAPTEPVSALLLRQQSLRTSKRDIRRVGPDGVDYAWVVPLDEARALAVPRDGAELVLLGPEAARAPLAPCAAPGPLGADGGHLVATCGGELVVVTLAGAPTVSARVPLPAPLARIEPHVRGRSMTLHAEDGRAFVLEVPSGRNLDVRAPSCALARAPLDETGWLELAGGNLSWSRDGRPRELAVPRAPGRTRLATAPDHAFVAGPDAPELVDVDLARGIARRVALPFAADRVLVLGLDPETVDVTEGAAHDGF